MATDFRSGNEFPRRGREKLGEFLWLARVFDKARAAANGTIHDYIYPCPMDRGVFERWGTNAAEFDAAVRANPTDDDILAWARKTISNFQRDEANHWLLTEKVKNMDKQDAEEGVVVA